MGSLLSICIILNCAVESDHNEKLDIDLTGENGNKYVCLNPDGKENQDQNREESDIKIVTIDNQNEEKQNNYLGKGSICKHELKKFKF